MYRERLKIKWFFFLSFFSFCFFFLLLVHLRWYSLPPNSLGIGCKLHPLKYPPVCGRLYSNIIRNDHDFGFPPRHTQGCNSSQRPQDRFNIVLYVWVFLHFRVFSIFFFFLLLFFILDRLPWYDNRSEF